MIIEAAFETSRKVQTRFEPQVISKALSKWPPLQVRSISESLGVFAAAFSSGQGSATGLVISFWTPLF
jgi:hypothetical protein